jgi:hypothetical protein
VRRYNMANYAVKQFALSLLLEKVSGIFASPQAKN